MARKVPRGKPTLADGPPPPLPPSYGYVCFPDTPHSTTSFFLNEDERALCISRLPPHTPVKMTWSSLKVTLRKAVVGWRWYLFSALFMVSATAFEAAGIYAQMGLWLKSEKTYTVEQVREWYSNVSVGTVLMRIRRPHFRSTTTRRSSQQ